MALIAYHHQGSDTKSTWYIGHLLRAFLSHGSGAVIVVLLRNDTGSQRVTVWDDGTNGCANAT